jgi:hypothetical protein
MCVFSQLWQAHPQPVLGAATYPVSHRVAMVFTPAKHVQTDSGFLAKKSIFL